MAKQKSKWNKKVEPVLRRGFMATKIERATLVEAETAVMDAQVQLQKMIERRNGVIYMILKNHDCGGDGWNYDPATGEFRQMEPPKEDAAKPEAKK